MAKRKEELFWIGRGVIQINGTDYDGSKPLPVSEMNPEVLDNQIAKGNIGEKIQVKGTDDAELIKAQKDANTDLKAKLKTVQEAVKVLESEKAELSQQVEDLIDEKATLKTANIDLQKEVDELTKPKGGK